MLLLLIGSSAVMIEEYRRSEFREFPTPTQSPVWLFDQSGIRNPQAIAPGSSELADSAEVIGVEMQGSHRAYAIGPMSFPRTHVINDVVGGTPVTVSYCNLMDCIRVFTDPKSADALHIAVGGLDNRSESRGMLLRVGERRYYQESGISFDDQSETFPYAQAEYVRTTWGQWRAEHPDTDIVDQFLAH
jgi:hypothetical protein